jgi:hypothetical protein
MVLPVIILQLTRLENGSVFVLTIKSPRGEPKGSFTPPYGGPDQSQAVSLALEAVKFERPDWQQCPEIFQALKDLQLGNDQGFKENLREQVGRTLFQVLFPRGGLRDALYAALDARSVEEPTTRVELRFDANATDLSALPWELLYDDNRGFLFAVRHVALIRYVTCELPRPEIEEAKTLNLLLVTARPIDQELPQLSDDESKAIENGLAKPIQQGRVRLEPLRADSSTQSTWDLLNEYLITHKGNRAPHIFHFDGHGGFGRRCPPRPEGCGKLNPANANTCRECQHPLGGNAEGYLAFEGMDKRPHWISAQELKNLFNGTGIGLAVLTACKSAVVAGKTVFGGMAPALIQAGVPAVVAMQFSVTVSAAKQFTQFFYLSLGQREPLTLAVGQARAALFADPTAWYRPVLYLRTDDTNPEGTLFAFPRVGVDAGRPHPAPMSFEQKMRLVDGLLACPSMSNRDTRDTVVDALPSDIRSSIRRSTVDRVDVVNVVTRCLDFSEGIQQLINIVYRFEGESNPMRQVRNVSSRLLAPGVSTVASWLPPSVVKHAPADPDTLEGRKLHWDRESIVSTFVGMMKGKPEYPWRVLGIRGPKEAGFNSLVDRLIFICNKLSFKASLLHARVHLRSGYRPHILAQDILRDLKNAATPSQVDALNRAYDDIGARWQAVPGRQLPPTRELAEIVIDCLKQVAQESIIALLIQNFEQVHDQPSGRWVRDEWLIPMACKAHNLVVVVTGEAGIGRSDRGIRYIKNLPPMSEKEFLEWAHEGYGLTTIGMEYVREINEEVAHGNPEMFKVWLKCEDIKKKHGIS